MARFYADENFPLPVVQLLRGLGHDVLTIAEAGRANQRFSDADVLRDATTQGRCVLTLNRKHFRRLHEEDASHAGIMLCTFDGDFEGQAARIDQAVVALDALEGQLIRINRPGP
jgi:predicted nuclease of predicted toxin-antitoxin system